MATALAKPDLTPVKRKPKLTLGGALKWLQHGRSISVPNCPACQDRFGQITFSVLLVVRTGFDYDAGRSTWEPTFEMEGGGNHPCALTEPERERIRQEALRRLDQALLDHFSPP